MAGVQLNKDPDSPVEELKTNSDLKKTDEKIRSSLIEQIEVQKSDTLLNSQEIGKLMDKPLL